MVTREEIADLIGRYVEMLKVPPKTQAERDFQLQILRHLRGMLGAWDALLKS